jgi:hypothetical protein
MIIEEQKNLKAIKKMNKEKKLGQLIFCFLKLLENDLMRYGVESICNVYLKQHPIKMGIRSGLNTMDHGLTTSFNRHPASSLIRFLLAFMNCVAYYILLRKSWMGTCN